MLTEDADGGFCRSYPEEPSLFGRMAFGKLNPSHFVGPSRSQGHGRPWFSERHPPDFHVMVHSVRRGDRRLLGAGEQTDGSERKEWRGEMGRKRGRRRDSSGEGWTRRNEDKRAAEVECAGRERKNKDKKTEHQG